MHAFSADDRRSCAEKLFDAARRLLLRGQRQIIGRRDTVPTSRLVKGKDEARREVPRPPV
jgi:hypothetical protein